MVVQYYCHLVTLPSNEKRVADDVKANAVWIDLTDGKATRGGSQPKRPKPQYVVFALAPDPTICAKFRSRNENFTMLKLETLDISGFKSFVDPVDLAFSGRISAIVGPNGCGKSNVADAITWVLGERSAKALRADTMGDVIFAGAAGRKPLGMAEVSLELSTDSSFPFSEEGRLTIGRRVYRSGESTFLINGKTGRLKDIKDLLSGTGLGLRAYSVIEQGKIDLILSGKPQERRRLLEEAAGVTKYRNRRHLTQLKLEETVSNLNRLDDIVGEVERSIRSLKRQAGAARRFKERRQNFRDLLQATLLSRAAGMRSTLQRVSTELATVQDSTASLAGQLGEREAHIASLRETSDQQGQTVSEHHRQEAELAAKIQGRQEFLQGAQRTIREIEERIASNQELAKRTRIEIEGMALRSTDLQSVQTETAAARIAAEQELTATDDLFSGAEELVIQEQASLEERRAALLEAFGGLTGERNRLHQQTTEKEKGQFRLRRVVEERDGKKDLLKNIESELTHSSDRVAKLRQTEQQARDQLDTETGKRAKLEAKAETLRNRRNQLEQQLSRLTAALEFLTEASQEQAARRARLERRLEESGIDNPVFLQDQIRAKDGWERAVDFFLDRISGALVSSDGSEDDLAAVLGSGEGSSTVLVRSDAVIGPNKRTSQEIKDTAILSPLAEALGLDPALGSTLPPAYLVKSWADARRLAESHPEAAFLCQDGRWIQGRLLRVLGEKAQPGSIARENERKSLETEQPRVRVQIEDLDRDLSELDSELTQNTQQVETLRSDLERAQREAAIAATKEEEAVATKTRLSSELRGLDNEKSEIEREIQRLDQSIEEHQIRVDDLSQRHGEHESSFDQQQKNLDQARERRENSRASGATRRGSLEVVLERLGANQRELERLGQDQTAAETRITSWNSEVDRLQQRKLDLIQEVESVTAKLQQALEAKTELESKGITLREGWEQSRQTLTNIDREVGTDRTRLETERNTLTELRVQQAGLQEKLEHVGADYREHFDDPLPNQVVADERPLEQLEANLEAARGVLERMGPVNELAAEELDEHGERYEFLTVQRTDVLESVESLRATIAEIDATSSERFLKTFTAVNQHFSSTFEELFAGGEAEMRLLDEDNVLESGIEIVARPPGKRLQNLMLMSGGEKALTALALLFALFRHTPSPFCVLDEVDAPLDDINCLRFVDMLRRMAKETQFIIITHNKLTMEAASTLYGVTMAERGVSKVVSVELDEIDAGITAAASA